MIKALQVGGESGRWFTVNKRQAARVGVELIEHVSGKVRQYAQRGIPVDAQLVIILPDNAGHGQFAHFRGLAKEQGIPVVYPSSPRYSADLEQQLMALGLIDPTHLVAHLSSETPEI